MPDKTPLQSTETMEQPTPPPIAPAGAIQHQGVAGAVVHDRPVAIPNPATPDAVDTDGPEVIAPPAAPPV